jgi:hypothetical protein
MIHVMSTTSVVHNRIIIMEDEAWLDEIQSLDVDDLDQWEHLTRTLDNPSFLSDPSYRDMRAEPHGAAPPPSLMKHHHGMNGGTAMAQQHRTAPKNVSLHMDDAGNNRIGNEYAQTWQTEHPSNGESKYATKSSQRAQLQSSYSHTTHIPHDMTASLAANETEPIPWHPQQQQHPHQQQQHVAAEMGLQRVPHSTNTMLRSHPSSHHSVYPPLPVVHPASDNHRQACFESHHHHHEPAVVPFEPMPSDCSSPPTALGTNTSGTVITMGPPLTAYNYYFRNERDTIVRGMRHADDPVPPSDEDYTPAKKAWLLHQHWYVPPSIETFVYELHHDLEVWLSLNAPPIIAFHFCQYEIRNVDPIKARRRHRKTHGVIEFST